MSLSEDYKKNRFNLTPFGIERGDTRSDYFCTPRGAAILGWTGVDGIHYCTVKSLGETVFAVNPYSDPKKHAFPVAEDFETFMRLLITCGHESVLEQAHAWTREQYERFKAENPITGAQKKIYEAFDFDTVPYKKDYYEWVPVEAPAKREWKVYFSSLGESGEKGERAGTELPIGKHVHFAGYDWHIPCAYACRAGMVLDMLAEVPAATVQAFLETWGHAEEDGGESLSEEERLMLEAQNPFSLTFSPVLIVNSRVLRSNHSRGNQYVSPEVSAREEFRYSDMETVLAYYGLSDKTCWMLRRFAFPWATAAKPKLRSIDILLRQKPVKLPGIRFHADAPGQEIPFTHPVTGIRHTLTITGCEAGEMTAPALAGQPYHYVELRYTVTPEIPADRLLIRDVRQNDFLRKSPEIAASPAEAAAIGIIGGADGPTALVFAHKRPDGDAAGRSAMSAVTYEKQERVEWLMVFREAPTEETTAELLTT